MRLGTKLYGDEEYETTKAIRKSVGKVIGGVRLEKNQLYIQLIDGSELRLRDEGQSCCEKRHMSTDDDLKYYVGATLLDFEIADGPTERDEYGEPHDQQFLKVKTSAGVFTCVTHNEHNGYYGGFYVKAALLGVSAPDDS